MNYLRIISIFQLCVSSMFVFSQIFKNYIMAILLKYSIYIFNLLTNPIDDREYKSLPIFNLQFLKFLMLNLAMGSNLVENDFDLQTNSLIFESPCTVNV